jgi:uncharacterized protein DUF3325
MTLLHLAVLTFALLGFIALAVAMPRHGKHLLQRALPPMAARMVRITGWLLLAIALAIGISQWRFSIGTVTWLGWLSLAGVALVFYLPLWPWQPVKRQRPARKPRPNTNTVGWVECNETQQTQNRSISYALASLVLLLPLAAFSWQLAATPQKPLMRNDALQGRIGPWTFVIAEAERKAPEIVALDVPLKEFVIRFCESCNAEIRQAYFKVRKPRSLRAAGNAFSGQQERHVEIPIPAAAALDDGLWLTVESNDGDVYHHQVAIENLSPSLAAFIKERS